MTKPFDPKKFEGSYTEYTLDMFLHSAGKDHAEIKQLYHWRENLLRDKQYTFEIPHTHAQRPMAEVHRRSGENLKLINLASYNYFGYSYHPEVIAAAKSALDDYGLGSCGSPILCGTFDLHETLEQKLVDFIGLENKACALFSSGYGANLGTVSAYIDKGDYVILDRSSHASLIDGALLSQGEIKFFKHNDAAHLEKVLKRIDYKNNRILVVVEGVYSTDGDYSKLPQIIEVTKRYGAKILVDEAHSFLVAGPSGRGVAEELGVLDKVDMFIITFSKTFGGVGGCLIASKEIVNYIRWYARSRMFSCALPPGITGGLIKVIDLASGTDGQERRKRVMENAEFLRLKLKGKVDLGTSNSWILPIYYGDEKKTVVLNDYLQRSGLDASLMMFPAVPKNRARIRAFVTSEHTEEELDKASEIIFRAAKKFNFNIS